MRLSLLLASLCLSFLLHAQQPSENEVPDVLTQLAQYEQAKGGKRLELANSLMRQFADLADTLYVFDRQTEDRYRDGMVYYWSAYSIWDEGDYAQALSLNEKALSLLEQTDSTDTYADCLALTTIIYTRLSDFVSAAQYAERTLALDRKSGRPENISSSLNTIAAIWSGAKQPEKAEKYIREALDIERQLDRPDILAIRLGLGSEILLKTDKKEEALRWAQEALEMDPREDRKAVRQSQVGAVLAALSRDSEAKEMLLKAKEGLQAVGNINSLCITLRQLAEIALRQGKQTEALSYLDQGMEICQTTHNLMLESQLCRMYSEALAKTAPAEALRYEQRYAQLNDTLYTQQLAQQLDLFDVKYDTAEKQHQLDLQAEQLSRNRLWMALLSLVAVVIIVVALLLFRLARARGRANAMLVKANLAKDELLRIAREEKIQAEEARQQLLAVADRITAIGDMPEVKLTKREQQLVQLFCRGLLSKEIADQLGISVRTVETHKSNIYKKIGVSNSVELLHYAEHQGWV